MLVDVELATGGAMAVLEGFAIAFMVSRWGKLKSFTWQWWSLAFIAITLLFTLPLIGLPYLLVEQNEIGTKQLFEAHNYLQIGWSLIVLSVPVLIIIGVALADYDVAEQAIYELKQDSRVKETKRAIKLKPSNGKLPDKLFTCEYCGKEFETEPQRRGHLGHCKLRQEVMENETV